MTQKYKETTVRRLLLILEELRKIDPELPLQGCLVFVCVMLNDGEITQKDIMQFTDLARSTTSRLVAGLVKKGVLASHQSVEDRRSWTISLTPEGRRIANTLVHIMET